MRAQPVACERAWRRRTRIALRLAQRSGLGRGARRAANRGASGAAQPAREPGRAGQAAGGNRARARAAFPTLAGERDARGPPAAAGARVLQRPRWLRRPRAGIRDASRRRAMDAGALDQRDRQSRVRLPGVGRGRWLHVVGEQPREPAHPLVERSRRRPAGRGLLRPRRRRGSAVFADGSPDSGGGRAVRRATRPGLQPLRAHVARDLARAHAIRGCRTTRSRFPGSASGIDPRARDASRSPRTSSGCSPPRDTATGRSS